VVIGFKNLTTKNTKSRRGIPDKKSPLALIGVSGLGSWCWVNSASHPRRRAVRVVVMVMMASRQHEDLN
jgi:hypothetical protein